MSLQKATITSEKGDVITAMFNPDQVVYSKTNNWHYTPTNGKSLPDGSFQVGLPATLQVTLMFDGTETGENISLIVDQLTKLTKVNDSLPNGTAPSARPAPAGGGSRRRRRRRAGHLAVQAGPAADRDVPVGPLSLVRRGHPEADQQVHPVPRRRDGRTGAGRPDPLADRRRGRVRQDRTPPRAAGRASGSTASPRARRSTRSPTPTSADRASGGPWPPSTGSTTRCGSRRAIRSSCRPASTT